MIKLVNNTFNPKDLSKDDRKQFAAFYTKKYIADLISSLVVSNSDCIVFDPACGSGSLLKSIFNHINRLKSLNKNDTEFMGIELIEPAYNEIISFFHSNISINSSSFFLGDTFDVLQRNLDAFHYLNFDFYTKQSSNIRNEKNVLVLCNPPFTKKQRIDKKYREIVVKFLGLEKDLNFGLHFYYIDLIQKILPIKGKFMLILPLTISFSEVGCEIIKNFLANITLELIIISEIETAFSNDSNLEEIILIGTKFKNNSISTKVQLINLKKEVTKHNWAQISFDIRKINKDSVFYSYREIDKNELKEKLGHSGWNYLYRSKSLNYFLGSIEKYLSTFEDSNSIQMKRGINLPADFFFIPNKYYRIEKDLENTIKLILINENNKNSVFKKTLIISKSMLKPIIRKPEYYKDKIIISKIKAHQNYVLNLSKSQTLENDLKEYIEFGKQINAHKRSNTKILKEKWYLFSPNTYFNIIFTFKWDPRYRTFLFNYSERPILVGQAFWGININTKYLKVHIAWLNSTLNMALIFNIADVQRRIWRQLSGSRIKSMNILQENLLSNIKIEQFFVFEEFINQKLGTNMIEEVTDALNSIFLDKFNTRVNVDLIFMEILNNNYKESNIMQLKEFYIDFKEELIRLTSNLK